MNKIKKSCLFRTISLVLILTFTSLDISYAYPPEHNVSNSTLATPSVLQQTPINDHAARFQQSVFSQSALIASVYDIGEYFFGNADKDMGSLPSKYADDAMRADLGKHLSDAGIEILNIVPVEHLKETVSEKLKVALDDIGFEGILPDKGVIFILCKKGDKRFLLLVAREGQVSSDSLPGYEWEVSDKYVVKYIPEDYEAPQGEILRLPNGKAPQAAAVHAHSEPVAPAVSVKLAVEKEPKLVITEPIAYKEISSDQVARDINRLVGDKIDDLKKLVNEFNNLKGRIEPPGSNDSVDVLREHLKAVEQRIAFIVDEINAHKPLKLEMPLLDSIDDTQVPLALIKAAEDSLIKGEYVPLFFFAGSMTRMRNTLSGIGIPGANPQSLYVLEVGVAMKEYLKANRITDPNVIKAIEHYLNFQGRSLIKMGPRQLRIYAGYIEKLAREHGLDPKKAIVDQKIVIAVNEKNEEEIFKDMVDHSFYGFSRDNVYFISQKAYQGYCFSRNGELVLNGKSEKFPFGPGIPIRLVAEEGVAFKLEPTQGAYKKVPLTVSLTKHLQGQGVQYIATHRVNDLTKFLLEEVVPIKKLAYSIGRIRAGANTVAEMVQNYEKRQKGAYLFQEGDKFIILEDPKIRGSAQANNLIDETTKTGKSCYSAFRIVYDLEALEDIARTAPEWNLRFTNGNLYLEEYAGDMTLAPSSKVSGYRSADKIHDLKSMDPVQLADAAEHLLKSDDDIQEIAWNQYEMTNTIERAEGFIIKQYLSGGSKSRVMLIERDGRLLVRKEERGDPSKEYVKLVDEINFLRQLPDKAKKHFVALGEFHIANKEGITWYEMPYYPKEEWMTLENLIIKGMITPEQTISVIDRILRSLIKDGLYEPLKITDKKEYVRKLITKKLQARMGDASEKSKEFAQILGRSMVINGEEYPPLLGMLDAVVVAVGESLAPDQLYRIHGDLFPENILVNYKDLISKKEGTNSILLDPKGGDSGYDIYYELAKLGESIIGLYGYALNERDDYILEYGNVLREGKAKVDLIFKPTQARKNYAQISELFVRYLKSRENPITMHAREEFDPLRYYVLLAHTIASTIPFNIRGYEYPKQPLLMYIMAIKILQQVIDQKKTDKPITVDSILGDSSSIKSRVGEKIQELLRQDKHVAIGFDIDGTLREHSEDKIRDDMIYRIIELAKNAGENVDVFICTDNDIDRVKTLFLDQYRKITEQKGLFDPDYFMYIMVQEGAMIYKYCPITDKLERIDSFDPISGDGQAAIIDAINGMVTKFNITPQDGQISVQEGGIRIKFTEVGVKATAEAREVFYAKDEARGLRSAYSEYLTPLVKQYGVFPFVKGRTSIDIMSSEINKNNGIRRLLKKIGESVGREALAIMFDDEMLELSEVSELLFFVGEKPAVNDFTNVVFSSRERGLAGSRATAQYIYEITDYLINSRVSSATAKASDKIRYIGAVESSVTQKPAIEISPEELKKGPWMQFKYHLDPSGKVISVEPGRLPSEKEDRLLGQAERGEEYAFHLRLAAQTDRTALVRLLELQERLKSIVPDGGKLYISSVESFHIALAGRYADKKLGILPDDLIAKTITRIVEQIGQSGLNRFSVVISGVRITNNGTIVLDLKDDSSLGRIRQNIFDVMKSSGWNESEIKVNRTPDGKYSAGGIITLGRIVPNAAGNGIFMDRDELQRVGQEISMINEELGARPIIVDINAVSFLHPTREFLSEGWENEKTINIGEPITMSLPAGDVKAEIKIAVAKPATQLFDLVESSLNNERAKYVEAGNKIAGGLDKNMTTAEIKERVQKVIEDIEKLDQKDVLPEVRTNIEMLKSNLSQFEADGGMASLIILARRAKREKQKLIIGLETDWIPAMNIKGSLQRNAIAALMKEIGSIGDALKSMGLDNVEIIRGTADSLADSLTKKAKESNTDMRNIIVMASKNTINSDSFKVFRDANEKTRPFLTGIDPTELIKLYTQFGEAVSKQLYIRLASLLYMTLELAAGKEPPQSPIIVSYDKKLRILILLPKADPIDYEMLKNNYAAEKAALQAA